MSEEQAKERTSPFTGIEQPGKVYIEVRPGVFVEGYLMQYSMEYSVPRAKYRTLDGDVVPYAQRADMTFDLKVTLVDPIEMPLFSRVRGQLRRPSVRGSVVGVGNRRPRRTAEPAPELPEPVMPELPEPELTPAARRFRALDLEDDDG